MILKAFARQDSKHRIFLPISQVLAVFPNWTSKNNGTHKLLLGEQSIPPSKNDREPVDVFHYLNEHEAETVYSQVNSAHKQMSSNLRFFGNKDNWMAVRLDAILTIEQDNTFTTIHFKEGSLSPSMVAHGETKALFTNAPFCDDLFEAMEAYNS